MQAEIEGIRCRVVELESVAVWADALNEDLGNGEERFRAILDDMGMVAVQGYARNRRVTF